MYILYSISVVFKFIVTIFLAAIIVIIASKNDSALRGPDFFIMGAQKAGTTATRTNLRLHPNIFLHPWELHWFDNHHRGSIQQYLRDKFSSNSIRSDQLIGDDTPIYMYYPNAVYDIYKHFPNSKLIFCLRDPVERLYSQFMMNKFDRTRDHRQYTIGRNESFESLIEKDMSRMGSRFPGKGDYLRRGIYVEQLERASSLFLRNQIHLICSEEIRRTLNYNDTFRFLGVPPMQVKAQLSYVSAKKEVMRDETRSLLSRFYAPWNKLLLRWLKVGNSDHRNFMKCVQNWEGMN